MVGKRKGAKGYGKGAKAADGEVAGYALAYGRKSIEQYRKENARGGAMTENELSAILVDICVDIHKRLGPGLLESVYESILVYELDRRGMAVERQVPISLVWDGIIFEESFRADVVLEKKVIVEIKALEQIHPVHLAQVLTYLRVSGYRLGMLVNFGCRTMKDGIRRIAYNLEEDDSLFVSE